MKMSVILPTYNDEPAMRRTLSGVLAEQEIEIEVVIVDDGSALLLPGNALLTDQRVRVLRHPANRGVSAARNTGLAAACGEYVYFADAGDIVSPDGLSILLREAEKTHADAVVGSYRLDVAPDLNKIGAAAPDLFPDNCLAMCAPAGVHERENFQGLLVELLKNDLFHPVAGRAYRRSALAGVCFDETVYCQLEDEMFNTAFFSGAKRVSVIEQCVATVSIAGDALSNRFDSDRRFNLLKLSGCYESLLNVLAAASDSPLAHECRRQQIFHYISMLANWRREAEHLPQLALFHTARGLLLAEPFRAAAEKLGLTEDWLVSTLNVVVESILPGVRRDSLPFSRHGDMVQNMTLTLEAMFSTQPEAEAEYALRAWNTGGRDAALRLDPDSLWRVWK